MTSACQARKVPRDVLILKGLHAQENTAYPHLFHYIDALSGFVYAAFAPGNLSTGSGDALEVVDPNRPPSLSEPSRSTGIPRSPTGYVLMWPLIAMSMHSPAHSMTFLDNCSTCWALAGASAIVFGLLVVHRLFLHHLRTFPGPKLAAITSLYKMYYEVYKGGELLEHILELHAIYGPVVRIAPNELHFNDYTAYADIYVAGSHFTKDHAFYRCFGADGSTFGAIQPHDSRIRRNILSPLFSRRAVLKFEVVVLEKVDRLMSRLADHHGKPINMFLAFRCTAMDIIASYCFSRCFNALDAEGFRDLFVVTTQQAIPSLWVMKYFAFLLPVAAALPQRLTGQFLLAFVNLGRMIAAQIDRILDDTDLLDENDNPTICCRLLNAPKGNDTRSRRDLVEEAFSLLQAGTEGPGNACTIGSFYILNDPVIYKTLFEELRRASPNKDAGLKLSVLEKLPYLTAVIKESLRMSHGLVSPLPRIVGSTNVKISGYDVPARTVVGVSATCLHNDSNAFPDPHKFSPDRWLQPSSRELERHLVPFSRGPRMCLGINLAWCELTLIFGNVFRKLDLDLYDTTVEDFTKFKDFSTPVHQGRNLHVFAKARVD